MRGSLNVRECLRSEVIERSYAAAAGFSVIALLVIYAPFEVPRYAGTVRAAAAVALLASLLRLAVAIRVRRQGGFTRREYRLVAGAIFVNAAAWATVFTLGRLAQANGAAFSVAGMVLVGFSAASTISLAPSRHLAPFFLITNIGGQILALGYEFAQTASPNVALLQLTYTVYLLYLLGEARRLRRGMVARFIAQRRLEIANQRLVRSRQELVEQTAQTMHASRLASLGEMAGGISHEVNNPLTIIDLSLEHLQNHLRRAYGEKDERINLALKRCRDAVTRVSGIVRSLRNLARSAEDDTFELLKAGDVLRDALDLCTERMLAHAIDFKSEADLEASLYGKSTEVAQVLINLLNNAFDAVKELPEGERWVKLKVRAEGAYTAFSVSDSGGGVSPAHREKLFQPFFTTKPPGVGTGLGLSISRAIALRHRGALTLAPEGPTTFELRLPSAP